MAKKPTKRPVRKKAEPAPKGRPPYEPTDELRAKVKAAVGFGMKVEQIAILIGVSYSTLLKYYGEEIALGRVNMEFQLTGKMYAMAMAGHFGALQYLDKTRNGHVERVKLEHSGPDGAPIPVEQPLKGLPLDKLRQIEKILAEPSDA